MGPCFVSYSEAMICYSEAMFCYSGGHVLLVGPCFIVGP